MARRLIHPVEDAFVPAGQGRGFSQGVISTWRRQNGGQPGGFLFRQVSRRFLEVVVSCRFGAIDSISPFGDIQIELQDSSLCQMMFEQSGEQGLVGSSEDRPSGGQGKVL